MELEYYLLTFSEIPYQRIPLAVIAHDGQKGRIRAIGLADNWDIDLAPFMALSARSSASAWVYETWLVTIKEIIGDTGNNHTEFIRHIESLGSNPVGFSLDKDGYIEIPVGGTVEGAIDFLHQELVTSNIPSTAN